MKQLLLCTLALFLTAGSCKKNAKNWLPPATQTGTNTFGFNLNGTPYAIEGIAANPRGPITSSGIICTVSSPYNYVSIEMVKYNKYRHYVSFRFKNNRLIPGTYTTGLDFTYSNILDPEKESKVVVTKYNGKILSGTFELYFLDKFDKNEKYALTDGRFDIRLDN